MLQYNCIGYRLIRIFKIQLELWICPPHSCIKPHIHPDLDSYVMHIWGRSFVRRKTSMKILPFFSFFRIYKIPRNVVHSSSNFNNWFIFLNIERWYSKPTSAAINLKEV
jgi:hypothetical protein